MSARIGVLGASGEVGRRVATGLIAAGVEQGADRPLVRLGARRPDALAAPGPGTQVVAADARDPSSLAAFCSGLDLVINCAGPSYALRDTVPAAALAAGADCVDVGGDDPAFEALTGRVPPGRRVLLSAGTVPGLSVLLPRLLADRVGDVRSVIGYAGGLEAVSPTVAAEVLLSLTVGGADGEPFGHPLAAVRGGVRTPRALRVLERAEHPAWPEPVTMQPLLTAEVERMARLIGARDADWYNAYPGRQVQALFARLPTMAAAAGTQQAAVHDRMVAAAAVDLAGRQAYYRMVVEVTGTAGTATATVRAPSSYAITAAVAVHAAHAVRAGAVPPGLHFAGDVLDPPAALIALTEAGVLRCHVQDRVDGTQAPVDGDGAVAVEEGVL